MTEPAAARAATMIEKLDYWCNHRGYDIYQFALSGPELGPPNAAWVLIRVGVKARSRIGGEDMLNGVKAKASPQTAQATLDEVARLFAARGIERVEGFQR